MSKNKYFTIDNLPATYEKRIFIGGNYKNIALLREICKFIKINKYQPILVADFVVTEGADNECSIFLLRQCKYAIFEMSTSGSGGECMELERTKDFKTITLILYQIIYSEDKPYVPAMIKSLKNVSIWGYPNLSELKRIITLWLCDKACNSFFEHKE